MATAVAQATAVFCLLLMELYVVNTI